MPSLVTRMVTPDSPTATEPNDGPVPWPIFLVEHPPARKAFVHDLHTYRSLETPDIKLYCEDEDCEREQIFSCIESGGTIPEAKWESVFLAYQCRNCSQSNKLFAVMVQAWAGGAGIAIKYGEIPPFGPVVPARVLRLIQPDVELFLKGSRAEAQGLGIGAFAYYRRVVENQKDRIFDAIIKVAKTVGATKEEIRSLEAAKEEFQFSKSVDKIKPYIPASLLIKTHNPLTVLHDTLSKGVHALTDAECLEWARNIRVVLTTFSGKVAEALKDDAEVTAALSSLMGPPPSAEAGEES